MNNMEMEAPEKASDTIESMHAHAQETAKLALSKALFEAQKQGITKAQIREILDLEGEPDNVN